MKTKTFRMEGISESPRMKVQRDRQQFDVEGGLFKEGKAQGSGKRRTLQRVPFEPHWICQSSKDLRTE